MRVPNNGGTPRKFSEKIAIIERKQNEENTTFEDIMRQVRSITHEPSSSTASSSGPVQIPQTNSSSGDSLHPPQQWLGGSLPNVHQMPSYIPPQWPPNCQRRVPYPNYQEQCHPQMQVPQQNVACSSHRSRSPEDYQQPRHYHPYRSNSTRSPDRVPPLHGNYVAYNQLAPPDNWNQINRARSDPAIHHMPNNQTMMLPPYNMPETSMNNGGLMGAPMYPESNGGSPLTQSPIGSPHGSSLVLDGTPLMELSPPAADCRDAGSLPNIGPNVPQMPYYQHAPVGPRHSTGTCGPRLAPCASMQLQAESQSAPTSPHDHYPYNQLDANQQMAWPTARTYSNSPESLDIPKVVLTNAEGTPGQHLECFNELEDLKIDNDAPFNDASSSASVTPTPSIIQNNGMQNPNCFYDHNQSFPTMLQN